MSKQEKPRKRIVEDTKGTRYELGNELSKGGQGVVFHTNYPGVLIKGFTNKNEKAAQRWRKQIEWLTRQDFTELKIAKPVALLKEPRNGYVMELMDGLIPLQSLLESFVEAEENAAEDYIRQGGLRRRIRILCQLANTLNQLHAQGMLYGDLSPSNIFVSDDPNFAETWLIDCDNISLESHNDHALYTQDYGAPEVVKGKALLSSLTDVWSFAVIAYQLLTHNHPLKGDMVNYGDPEVEEAAMRGEHPWINDSEDIDNECMQNLPPHVIEHSRLPQLFAQCFEQGKSQPLERPSMAQWLEALTECDERLVLCESCGAHNLFAENSDSECFFCEAKIDPNLVVFEEFIVPTSEDNTPIESSDWIPSGRKVVLQPGVEKELKRLLPSYAYSYWPSDHLKIEFLDKGLKINATEDDCVTLQRGSKTKLLSKGQGIPLAKRGQDETPFWLHIGELATQHIVWQFRW
ncbi:protein kinase domain-containing protein [Salinibius halmophilus]|uniref:protein kinase domain-containing protein n=1 Tax=Salinibius halmophilus TaxID=1853216 RepID=UPI000E66508A|nr:protein kinase [Salinibius halmophilus]